MTYMTYIHFDPCLQTRWCPVRGGSRGRFSATRMSPLQCYWTTSASCRGYVQLSCIYMCICVSCVYSTTNPTLLTFICPPSPPYTLTPSYPNTLTQTHTHTPYIQVPLVRIEEAPSNARRIFTGVDISAEVQVGIHVCVYMC